MDLWLWLPILKCCFVYLFQADQLNEEQIAGKYLRVVIIIFYKFHEHQSVSKSCVSKNIQHHSASQVYLINTTHY